MINWINSLIGGNMGVSENSVPLNHQWLQWLMIIIPIKWFFHWEYTLFSDKPIQWCSNITMVDPLEWLLAQYYIRLFKIKWKGVKHYNAIGFSGWISINLNSILVWTSIPGFWSIAIQCGTPPLISWLITPEKNRDISTISPSEIGVINQLSYLWRTTLYLDYTYIYIYIYTCLFHINMGKFMQSCKQSLDNHGKPWNIL